jgi:hypothetical protein
MARDWMSLVAVAAFAVAGEAQAGALPFQGTLSFQLGALSPLILTGSGVAGVNGSGGLGALSSVDLVGGTFAGTATAMGPPPIVGLIGNFSNGTGSFVLGGPMALPGNLRLCLFGACSPSPPANLNVPLTLGGTRGVGLGGAFTGMFGAGPEIGTVRGAAWTVGTAVASDPSMPTQTRMGFVHGPASGGASSAAAASGVLQLVTPAVIRTSPSTLPLAAFGTLTLHFVPEPGTLALSLAGALGLALLARQRTRH